jgi:ATP-binding cassette, subfamily C, bacterial LapB
MNHLPISSASLVWALQRLAQLQGTYLAPAQLDAAVKSLGHEPLALADITQVCRHLNAAKCTPLRAASADDTLRAQLPVLAFAQGEGWGLVTDQLPTGEWVFSQEGKSSRAMGASSSDASLQHWVHVQLDAHRADADLQQENAPGGIFKTVLRAALKPYRGVLSEAALASVFINLLALGASLFSMQVYDRVIPSRSDHTLLILGVGVGLATLFELAMKLARSHVMDRAVVGLDTRLSRTIFARLMAVRVDQLPGSVGTLASQLRGHEQLRSFYTASTLFTIVDLPMALMFAVMIAVVGSPLLVAVPLVFAVISLSQGLWVRRRVDRLALEGAQATNRKTGLLVEAVESVETIKAGGGAWKFLARWMNIHQQTVQNDLRMRHTIENMSYSSAALQQISYAALVGFGALLVMRGDMSSGALIACSILSGRVLSPVASVPNLWVQYAHAKAAMKGLEKLFELKTDNHQVERPITPQRLQGHFVFDQVEFAYPQAPPAVQIARLEIKPGEHIGVLGPIGSGKSTFLRLLAGLYHPHKGRVLLDGLDVTQIHQQILSRHIAYLQQDTRLFEGSLRENLLIGLPDPGDDVLQQVLMRSGLLQWISQHPRGLELPIYEGGRGLSGGQRQLLAFTRLLLCQPDIWLLDEPTASMDESQEQKCLQILQQEVKPLQVDSEGEKTKRKTLVVVTHKASLLPLFDRIIVLSGHQIVLDGPRELVLAKLQQNNVVKTPAAASGFARSAMTVTPMSTAALARPKIQPVK